MKKQKRLSAALLAILIMAALVAITGCQRDEGPAQNPQATIEMEDGKVIVIELLPDMAPNTVNNFLKIAQAKEYDGTFFHRILLDPGVLQGGAFYMDEESPEGFSVKETGYSIRGEFANNGFEQNTLKHERGVISMARAQDFDSGSNQFFIMAGPQPMYDGEYCGFGRVIEGMENVDAIIQFAVDNGMDNPATIKTVKVDTFGSKWPDPETIAG